MVYQLKANGDKQRTTKKIKWNQNMLNVKEGEKKETKEQIK